MAKPQEWKKLPRHIAFIMDGNGRWARTRGFLRLRGHQEGAEALRRVTRRSRALGVQETTFYALSTENFTRRPPREVKFLLKLLKDYLVQERRELLDNNIRLKAIGDVKAFPADVLRELAETERLTETHDGMVMRLALNYGARQEILAAVRRISRSLDAGELRPEAVEALSEDQFRQYLDDPTMSDPDLLIRTAGECRLSNFLLWQSSYSEIWVTSTLWPDFDEATLEEALREYEGRVRKYGALDVARISSQGPSSPGEGGARVASEPSDSAAGASRGE